MLLDAYIHRSEVNPWRRPRGGTQHIRMKVGDMKKGVLGDLPADIYQGSLIVGTGIQDVSLSSAWT